MVLTFISGILVAVCLVTSVIFYVFIRTRNSVQSAHLSPLSINEKQQIKYSIRPSIDIVTKKLSQEFFFRTNLTGSKSHHSSSTIHRYDENEIHSKRKAHHSIESINSSLMPLRSTSVGTNICQVHRPRSTNWRQGSIIDSNQMALIQFSLPRNHHDKNKYRRRSVPICNEMIQPKPLSSSSFLLSFSMIYLNSSQLKIQFQSVTGLPLHLHLQQLTFKVKLFPDGKEKSIQIRKLSEKENCLGDDRTNEYFIYFLNISLEKLRERSVLITIYGKDQAKKTIHLGQIGKIHFNQLNPFQEEKRLDFTHEIEKHKPSSIELLIALEKKNGHYIHVDLQRLKGLKIDQKNLDATCYLRLVLLDRHRPLTTHQTEFHRLNSSTLIIAEQYDLNILGYNANNFDRLMLMISIYSNVSHDNEHRCLARLKVASPLFCSGNGMVHWQQFKARESFSMWHTLDKYQPL